MLRARDGNAARFGSIYRLSQREVAEKKGGSRRRRVGPGRGPAIPWRGDSLDGGTVFGAGRFTTVGGCPPPRDRLAAAARLGGGDEDSYLFMMWAVAAALRMGAWLTRHGVKVNWLWFRDDALVPPSIPDDDDLAVARASALNESHWGRYDPACYFALRGMRADAVQHLRRSADPGLASLTDIRSDPDLASLRGDPRARIQACSQLGAVRGNPVALPGSRRAARHPPRHLLLLDAARLRPHRVLR